VFWCLKNEGTLDGLGTPDMEESGLAGILNSDLVGEACITGRAELVSNRDCSCCNNGVGFDGIIVFELAVEVVENIEGAGEIVNGRLKGTIAVLLGTLGGVDSVIGKPSSIRMFHAFAKSASFLNFS